MRKCLTLCVLSLLFASCATMLNGSYTKTKVKTDRPRTIIVHGDSIQLAENEKITVTFERSKEPQTIVVLTDDRVDSIGLRARYSGAYLFNIIMNYGLGCIVDGRDPRIWGYPQTVELTAWGIKQNRAMHSMIYKPRLFRDNLFRNSLLHENTWAVRGSLPWVNWFSLTDGERGRGSNVGFAGVSLGVDYYYNGKKFINLTGTAIANIFIPVPAAVDISGLWQHKYSFYGTATHNHMFNEGRVSVGYGLSVGRDTWNTILHKQWMDRDDPLWSQYLDVYRRSTSLGLAVSAYYYTKRQFYLGAVYRPMLWRIDCRGTKFQYQHTFSVDAGWRIRLSRKR